ncbi:MAG: tail fiber domain-containing protein [Pseudomonadota bacterium]
MARDGSGTYSFPAGTDAVSGETISSTKYNTRMDDLEADANVDRPVAAGGTGASTPAGARQNLDAQQQSDLLDAIAALSTVADRLIYATGNDTVALTTLTSFARTLLDDANAAAMRSTLGVNQTNIGITPFMQTVLDDTTAAQARATLGVGTGNGDMIGSNNLSDVTNATTARNNIGAYGSGSNAGFGTLSATGATSLASLSVSGSSLVGPANDFVKQLIFGTTSAIEMGNTESTGGTFRLEYDRVTGRTNFYSGAAHATLGMTMSSTGQLGIGTNNPTRRLEVNSGADTRCISVRSTTTGAKLELVDNSTTSGVYLGAIDENMVFETNGQVERARIDGAGRFGMGVTTPQVRLEVSRLGGDPSAIPTLDANTALLVHSGAGSSGSGAFMQLLGGNTSAVGINFGDVDTAAAGSIVYTHTSNAMVFGVAGAERFRIASTGDATLQGSLVVADNTPRVLFTDTDTGGDSSISADSSVGSLFISADFNNELGNSVIGFNVDGSERMRINSSGNVGIGTTSISNKLQVNGDVGAVDFNASSDERLKENFRDFNALQGLQYVLETVIKRYNRKGSPEEHIGPIAQQMQKVFPDGIREDGDGYLFVDMLNMIGASYAAIQALNAKLEALQNGRA